MTAPDMIALQWANIQHITEFDDLSPEDYVCLEEVRRVLTQHRRLNKFGVALLHRHFRLNDDEVFVESVDPYARTLTATATRRAEIDIDGMQETLWRFGPNVGDIHAQQKCPPVPTHDVSDPHPSPSPSPLPGPTEDPSPRRPNPNPSPSPRQ
jgi:hypothetical protein